MHWNRNDSHRVLSLIICIASVCLIVAMLVLILPSHFCVLHLSVCCGLTPRGTSLKHIKLMSQQEEEEGMDTSKIFDSCGPCTFSHHQESAYLLASNKLVDILKQCIKALTMNNLLTL